MKIEVNIKQQKTIISCGDSSKTIRWLADAGLIWYTEHTNSFQKKGKIISPPTRVSRSSGQELNMNQKIIDCLDNNQSVYVYLKEQVQWQKLGKGN